MYLYTITQTSVREIGLVGTPVKIIFLSYMGGYVNVGEYFLAIVSTHTHTYERGEGFIDVSKLRCETEQHHNLFIIKSSF